MLPPIDKLPARGGGPRRSGRQHADVLRGFVGSGTRPWSGEPVPLSGSITVLFWLILIGNVAFGAWLLAVRAGTAPCTGIGCTVATLGDNPHVLLVLSGSCVVSLVGSAIVTRGLTTAGAIPLAVSSIGAVAGVVALLGVLGLLVITAVALMAVLLVLVTVIERA